MSATETAIPLCCTICQAVPEDPAALRNFGSPGPGDYWLCRDTAACAERVLAARHTASETPTDSAPGAAQEDTTQAVPPVWDEPPAAAPGAVQDEAPEAEPQP